MLLHFWFFRVEKNDEKSCEFMHAWKLVDIPDFEIELIFLNFLRK